MILALERTGNVKKYKKKRYFTFFTIKMSLYKKKALYLHREYKATRPEKNN